MSLTQMIINKHIFLVDFNVNAKNPKTITISLEEFTLCRLHDSSLNGALAMKTDSFNYMSKDSISWVKFGATCNYGSGS